MAGYIETPEQAERRRIRQREQKAAKRAAGWVLVETEEQAEARRERDRIRKRKKKYPWLFTTTKPSGERQWVKVSVPDPDDYSFPDSDVRLSA